MSKQLEAAKAATAKALALNAAITSTATNPKAVDGDPAQTEPAPADGGDDMQKRMTDLEAKCSDLEERIKALEEAGNAQAEASSETAKALQAVNDMLNRFTAQFNNPALARIGAAAKPSASAAVAEKTAFEIWQEMPEGQAKNDYLNAHAKAINATAK